MHGPHNTLSKHVVKQSSRMRGRVGSRAQSQHCWEVQIIGHLNCDEYATGGVRRTISTV